MIQDLTLTKKRTKFVSAPDRRVLIRHIAAFAAIAGSAFSTVGQTIYEAENAALSGPSIGSQWAGYSGKGYADYSNASGDYVEFSLSASSSEIYSIAFLSWPLNYCSPLVRQPLDCSEPKHPMLSQDYN